ncbi:UNVERIFIED_CONTAM: hypothetical protein RMT77_007593 [Armadillidium vulgare]|nr:Transmembrane protein 69 [Armadillidium vulgare]
MIKASRLSLPLYNITSNTLKLIRNTSKKTIYNCSVTCSKNAAIDRQKFHTSNLSYFQENETTKSLAILDSVKQVRESPIPALVLGLSGLIPFVAAPSYIISCGVFMPHIAYGQLAYAATILSFIGGMRWGLTLPQGSTQSPDWHNLIYSITPSLIAWGSLLVSPTVGSAILMGGLGLTGYMDMAMWGYPNWFKGLRFCLTLVAVLSLWTTLMCSLIMKPVE